MRVRRGHGGDPPPVVERALPEVEETFVVGVRAQHRLGPVLQLDLLEVPAPHLRSGLETEKASRR